MPLEPPSERNFPTLEEAQTFLQAWSKQQGYAIVRANLAKGGTFVYFGCDKGGKLKNSRSLTPADRRRDSSTSKTGCPFRLRVKAISSSEWELTVVNPAHNHDPSLSTLAHPAHRRFDVATKYHILDLARIGTKPKAIMAHLRQLEEPVDCIPKDVSNLLQKHRRELLEGRAPAEALLEWLEEQQWPHIAKFASDGTDAKRLEGLLFTHPLALHLLRRFGSVVIIDATYNTNKHRMPLLHIGGITSSNRTFTVALAFLPDETAISYSWAIKALLELEEDWKPDVVVTDDDAALGAALTLNFTHKYSHIHCQWHVRKNVEKVERTRLLDDAQYEAFMSDFDEIRDARTLDDMEEARDNLAARWEGKWNDLVDYVDGKLSSQAYWVAAFINWHPHMGTKVTSRIEACHATMKQFLHSRHGSLFSVVHQLSQHFIIQQTNIESDLAGDMNKVGVTILGDPFYNQLVRNVSRHALRLISVQDEIARRILGKARKDPQNNEPATPCTCTIFATMGLPCCHTLAHLRALGQPIDLATMHPQWQTSKGLTGVRVPRVLDPLDPRQKKIVAATTSTGRLLTAAELAHATKKKMVRRCRNCHQAGHNCSRCPQPCGICKSPEHTFNHCTM